MIKKFLLPALLLLPVLQTAAAQGLSSDEMKKRILESGSRMESIVCDFVQTKTMSLLDEKMVSTGKMTYVSPDVLAWEYTSPVNYAFRMKGSTVSLERDGTLETFDVKDNKMIREIARLIMGSIAGSTISNEGTFRTTVEDAGGEWIATMVPVRKDAQKLWTSLVLRFSPVRRCAIGIVMNEASGDITAIDFKNITTTFK